MKTSLEEDEIQEDTSDKRARTEEIKEEVPKGISRAFEGTDEDQEEHGPLKRQQVDLFEIMYKTIAPIVQKTKRPTRNQAQGPS